MASDFLLMAEALANLQDIERHSIQTWGKDRAERYLADLYGTFAKLAKAPDRDQSRYARSAPFRMVAAQEHFIVFDVINDDVIVITLLHQSSHVEKRLASQSKRFKAALAEFSRRL